MRHGLVASLVCAAALLGAARAARALDKQGSAHGGGIEGPTEGFDLSGSASLGVSLYNPTYAARPDNTGLALFRYAAHAEISFWNEHLAIGLDAIFFTDKLASNVFRPTELDFTPEIIVRHERYEVHLAYERDMPVDQDSLIQQFVYLLASVSF